MGGPARAEAHIAVRRAQAAGQRMGAAERNRGTQRAPHPQVLFGSHGRLTELPAKWVNFSPATRRNK